MFFSKTIHNNYDFEKVLKKAKYYRKLSFYQSSEFSINQYNSEILKFENLKILKIHFSDMSSKLPENIGNLKHLKKLHILNTYFKEFPEWIFKLNKLENLMLRGNEIDKIPSEIKLLKHLKHFKFENTNLNKIPIEIKELKKLETLSFVDNFRLVNFNKSIINGNLKMLALKPTNIEEKVIDELKKEYPKLKIGKRYYK